MVTDLIVERAPVVGGWIKKEEGFGIAIKNGKVV
jgi:hypothetical protein